jgi:hypothetical protein
MPKTKKAAVAAVQSISTPSKDIDSPEPNTSKPTGKAPANSPRKGKSELISEFVAPSSPARLINIQEADIEHIDGHKTIHFEFGGPLGAAGVIFGLPLVIYLLYFLCNDSVCLHSPWSFDWTDWYTKLPSWVALFSWEATYMYLGWIALHVLLERYKLLLLCTT